MKRIIVGVFLGIVILALLLYFGGGRYVKIFGAHTEEAGVKLEKYGKQMKDSTKGAREAVDKTVGAAKEKIKGLVNKEQ